MLTLYIVYYVHIQYKRIPYFTIFLYSLQRFRRLRNLHNTLCKYNRRERSLQFCFNQMFITLLQQSRIASHICDRLYHYTYLGQYVKLLKIVRSPIISFYTVFSPIVLNRITLYIISQLTCKTNPYQSSWVLQG